MVSWGTAFKKGAIIFLWGIVWTIIYLVFFGIAAVLGFAMFIGTQTLSEALTVAIGGFVVVVIGTIIYAILMLATIVKITMESTLEEAKK